MRIAVYLVNEPQRSEIYKIPEVSTSDLPAFSPFQDGVDLPLHELLSKFEMFKSQLKDMLESEDTTSHLPITNQPEATGAVDPSADGASQVVDVDTGDLVERVSELGNAARVGALPQIETAVQPAKCLEGDEEYRSRDLPNPNTFEVDAYTQIPVEPYLPLHVLREIATTNRYVPDLSVTRLSITILMEKVIQVLQRNHRPPTIYRVKVSE